MNTHKESRKDKKENYKLGICGQCEKPMLLKAESLVDYRKRVKKMGQKSFSKFDHNELNPVKRLCGCPIEYVVVIPYSDEKAKQFLKDNL